MACRPALLLTLLLGAPLLTAQSPTDSSFQVSSSQPWTDTGLDLQPGDVLQISSRAAATAAPDPHVVPGTPVCDPSGRTSGSGDSDLPLVSAPAGALIARLRAQGAAPVLVGARAELRIQEPSHLFLGMNVSAVSACRGGFVVDVHHVPASSPANGTPEQSAGSNSQAATGSSSPSGSAEGQQSRGQQLKSQLGNAAQIFMSGQFGVGKGSSPSNSATANATSSASANSAAEPSAGLNISQGPIDPDLRKSLDTLPRRVNDQFQNLGDMINFVVVGSQKDVQAAFEAASWHVADTGNSNAVVNAIMQTYDRKDYLAMPMSTLFLFGRKQDFGYELAEPIAMVASRHHFRIWKAPFTWMGHEVWVGAGTHDIGFAKDKRNGNLTHKIDPAVDGERDNIGSSLQKANTIKMLSYYLPPNPVQDARNATGDGYHSDGRLLVIFLQ